MLLPETRRTDMRIIIDSDGYFSAVDVKYFLDARIDFPGTRTRVLEGGHFSSCKWKGQPELGRHATAAAAAEEAIAAEKLTSDECERHNQVVSELERERDDSNAQLKRYARSKLVNSLPITAELFTRGADGKFKKLED